MINDTKHVITRCSNPQCVCCHCEKCNWARENTVKGVEVRENLDKKTVELAFMWTVMQVPWLRVRVA